MTTHAIFIHDATGNTIRIESRSKSYATDKTIPTTYTKGWGLWKHSVTQSNPVEIPGRYIYITYKLPKESWYRSNELPEEEFNTKLASYLKEMRNTFSTNGWREIPIWE